MLSTHCLLSECNYIVTSDIFKRSLKNEKDALKIYNKCLIHNFTESNSDIKLCPNPKCDVNNKISKDMEWMEIKYQCGFSFCFKCLRESHHPWYFEMVQMLEEKSKSEGENTKRVLVNTKQCPRCHKYIEKNQGFTHMTCRKWGRGMFIWILLDMFGRMGTTWVIMV